MFFREKISQKSNNPTLQLVENYRDGAKVRQNVVVSLGIGFEIATDQRKLVAAEELIDASAEGYSENRFYHISDLLLKNKDFIEQQLYEREKSLFNLTNTIFLYDLTNTYFEGLCKGNPKAKFCNNQKEKRTDCRQIVIALFLDSDGFIRRHRIFDGNVSDAKSLRHILTELKHDFPTDAVPTIIMDRGVVCDENIKLVKSAGFHYIVTTRPNEEQDFVEDFKQADFKIIKNNKDNQVEIYLKKENDASYLLCKSELKQAKKQSMRNQREQWLDSDLENMRKSITSGKRIDPLAIETSIGRLKEKHSAVAKYYYIEFKPYFSGIPIDEKRAESEDLDGNYLIKTDRSDLADAQIWKMYTMLTLVEKAFRTLKTDLKLRLNYHQKERRVDGHVLITILAYHLLHSIEHTLRDNDCTSSWATVKRVVSSHVYTTITLPTTSGSVIHLRKPGIPELIHEEIYKKLRVNWVQLPSCKFEVKEKVR